MAFRCAAAAQTPPQPPFNPVRDCSSARAPSATQPQTTAAPIPSNGGGTHYIALRVE